MRLQLNRIRRVAFGLVVFVGLASVRASAENRVTVRGQYYREPSTRVVQPVTEMRADLPAGVDMSAHFLLDAITSASAAAGPNGDNIFTEYRNEASVGLGKNWSRGRVGGFYRYSAESDYWSHTAGVSTALRLWNDTATLALSSGLSLDQVGRRAQGNAPAPAPGPGEPCMPSAVLTCSLKTVFAGIGYSQVFSPTWLVQAGYEIAVMNGFLSNPYRAKPPYGAENLGNNRVRQALSARAAHYFVATRTGVQLHYRYYWDAKWNEDEPFQVLTSSVVDYATNPWSIRGHTVEGRLFQALGSDLEFRLTGRFYSQGAGNFLCDQDRSPGCYLGPLLWTGDPKLSMMSTGYVELKGYWEATRWRTYPFFNWFAEGTFELSYGTFIQSTAFGTAHVLQTAYSLPF